MKPEDYLDYGNLGTESAIADRLAGVSFDAEKALASLSLVYQPEDSFYGRLFLRSYNEQVNLYAKADESACNWKKFDSFLLGDSEIGESGVYAIFYTSHRDSDPLARSNAQAIDKRMQPFYDDESARGYSASHWLVGYAEGLAIKVFTDETKAYVSPAFIEWLAIQAKLADYPVLDEDLWSQLESDEDFDLIKEETRFYLSNLDCEPKIDHQDVLEALSDHNINYGYWYYGECYIKSEDFEKAIIYACMHKHDYTTLKAILAKRSPDGLWFAVVKS